MQIKQLIVSSSFCLISLQLQALALERKIPLSPDDSQYIKVVQTRVKKFWRTSFSTKPSHTLAAFKIGVDGKVSSIKILEHGSSAEDDTKVVEALKSASPFPPPPASTKAPIDIEFRFDSLRPKPLGLTVGQALKRYGADAKKRLLEKFLQAEIAYPPKEITILGLKEEQQVQVFAKDKSGKFKFIASYPLVSFSGGLGPKLREGDLQIPEGFYRTPRIDASTHLCLWVDYPNQQDKAYALRDGRRNLGGDIQIHEGVYSTGCLVIGHDQMAELFVLAHDIGLRNVFLVIAPCNLSIKDPAINISKQPKWLPDLYKRLKAALVKLPVRR